jgi:hypothetical protein
LLFRVWSALGRRPEQETMADDDERGDASPAAEGIEMTAVDLSSPLPPRHPAPGSPPVVR